MTMADTFTTHFTAGSPGASYAMPITAELPTTLADLIEQKQMAMAEGRKYDSDKPRIGLVPPKSLIEVAKVLTYGAKKYSAENWRQVEGKEWRYFDAAQRHLWQYHSGQVVDSETNINHLAHAICSLMFLLELDLEKQP